MTDIDRRLWPFGPRLGLLWSAALLIVLVLVAALLETTIGWPGDQAEGAVLIAIVVLSLLPIVLTLLDVIIVRGAVVEYRGIKVDFSQSGHAATPGFVVPPNIGVQGQPLTDSDTAQILDALRHSTSSRVVIVDLEVGSAWWETRLLVLLAGASRLGRPERIVFVATDAGKERQFKGWAEAGDLLRPLVEANPQYAESLIETRAAASKWDLAEQVQLPPGPQPAWIVGTLAGKYSWMVLRDARTRNELLAEQMLQAELGQRIEALEGSRKLTLVRLEELFRPFLTTDRIDLSWPSEHQMDALLGSSARDLAVTRDGTHVALVSRVALLAEALKPILKPRR